MDAVSCKKGKKLITIQSKCFFLRNFDNLEDAAAARKASEEKCFAPILEKYND